MVMSPSAKTKNNRINGSRNDDDDDVEIDVTGVMDTAWLTNVVPSDEELMASTTTQQNDEIVTNSPLEDTSSRARKSAPYPQAVRATPGVDSLLLHRRGRSPPISEAGSSMSVFVEPKPVPPPYRAASPEFRVPSPAVFVPIEDTVLSLIEIDEVNERSESGAPSDDDGAPSDAGAPSVASTENRLLDTPVIDVENVLTSVKCLLGEDKDDEDLDADHIDDDVLLSGAMFTVEENDDDVLGTTGSLVYEREDPRKEAESDFEPEYEEDEQQSELESDLDMVPALTTTKSEDDEKDRYSSVTTENTRSPQSHVSSEGRRALIQAAAKKLESSKLIEIEAPDDEDDEIVVRNSHSLTEKPSLKERIRQRLQIVIPAEEEKKEEQQEHPDIPLAPTSTSMLSRSGQHIGYAVIEADESVRGLSQFSDLSLANLSTPAQSTDTRPLSPLDSLTGNDDDTYMRMLSQVLSDKSKSQESASPPPPPPPPPPRQSISPTDQSHTQKSRSAAVQPSVYLPPPMDRRTMRVHSSSPTDQLASSTRTSLENAGRHMYEELEEDASLWRLSRTVRYGRRGGAPPRFSNTVRLHIYDLIQSETVMALPLGFEFPIGKCFQTCNSTLHALGTGAYHCGVEVNGVEYAYGANEIEGSTGVFTCIPKRSPGYEFRSTLDFGQRPLVKKEWVLVELEPRDGKESPASNASSCYREMDVYLDGRNVMREMAAEYKGMEYDLLRKNCCTFAKDACLRLGIKESEIPSWFMNLSDVGASAQDAVFWKQVRPTKGSSITIAPNNSLVTPENSNVGFEAVMCQAPLSTPSSVSSTDKQQTVVQVVDTTRNPSAYSVMQSDARRPYLVGEQEDATAKALRRTTSWTY